MLIFETELFFSELHPEWKKNMGKICFDPLGYNASNNQYASSCNAAYNNRKWVKDFLVKLIIRFYMSHDVCDIKIYRHQMFFFFFTELIRFRLPPPDYVTRETNLYLFNDAYLNQIIYLNENLQLFY